jgi:hypothetical protein
MPFTAVMFETPDGRICGHVRELLNTTVYAATEEECIAALKVAMRLSLKRTLCQSIDTFAGIGRPHQGERRP